MGAGARTALFWLDGIKGQERAYLDWLLGHCTADNPRKSSCHAKGADFTVKDAADCTVLMFAAKHPHPATFSGDTRVVRTLLAAGAEVDAQDAYGGTALMSAWRPDIARLLIGKRRERQYEESKRRHPVVVCTLFRGELTFGFSSDGADPAREGC